MPRHPLYLCRECLTPTVHRVDGRGLCLKCQGHQPMRRRCMDCGDDISDRAPQTKRCFVCANERNRALASTSQNRQRRKQRPPLRRIELVGKEQMSEETLAKLAEYEARGRDARDRMVI